MDLLVSAFPAGLPVTPGTCYINPVDTLTSSSALMESSLLSLYTLLS